MCPLNVTLNGLRYLCNWWIYCNPGDLTTNGSTRIQEEVPESLYLK